MAILGAGGGIKSIQRGVTTGGAKTASTTATINAVDLAKSFISCSCANGYDVDRIYNAQTNFAINDSLSAGATLTNTTTVTFTTGNHYAYYYIVNANPTIYWEVIEYE